MPIKLAITGRASLEIEAENIMIGSDRNCTVAIDDSTAMPRHAVIRRIAGRWLIEVREAPAVFVAGPFGHTEANRLQWLVPDDQFRITENGPVMTFEPSKSDSAPPMQSQSASRAVEDVIDEILMLRESDATLIDVGHRRHTTPLMRIPSPRRSPLRLTRFNPSAQERR